MLHYPSFQYQTKQHHLEKIAIHKLIVPPEPSGDMLVNAAGSNVPQSCCAPEMVPASVTSVQAAL